MDEFVSKKLLVAKFNELASKYTDGDKRQRGLAYATAADIVAITDATDVQPVKRGKWDGYICSECNVCADYFISGDFYFDEKPDYCPNCGARMDGDVK